MRASRIFVLAIALLLQATAPAVAKGPHHEVPIKGTVSGVHGLDLGAPDCDPGALWRFESSGSGTMSHLGRVDYELTQCTFFDPELGFVFRDGTITFTAANGDELVIAQTGTSQVIGAMEGFTGEGTWVVVPGGTGRFANATGAGTMEFIGDIPDGMANLGLPDGIAVFDFTGDIAYDASDRGK